MFQGIEVCFGPQSQILIRGIEKTQQGNFTSGCGIDIIIVDFKDHCFCGMTLTDVVEEVYTVIQEVLLEILLIVFKCFLQDFVVLLSCNRCLSSICLGIPPHIDTHSAFEDEIIVLSLGSQVCEKVWTGLDSLVAKFLQ